MPNVCTAENLLGSPVVDGVDFPRVIAGHSITEAQYTIHVRKCAVAIDIMEEPIRDMAHLTLSLQIKYFLHGAQNVSGRNLNFGEFLDQVRTKCNEDGNATLAKGVLMAAEDLIEQ